MSNFPNPKMTYVRWLRVLHRLSAILYTLISTFLSDTVSGTTKNHIPLLFIAQWEKMHRRPAAIVFHGLPFEVKNPPYSKSRRLCLEKNLIQTQVPMKIITTVHAANIY